MLPLCYMGWFCLGNKNLVWCMRLSSLQNIFFVLLFTLHLNFQCNLWCLNIEDLIYKVNINVWHYKYFFYFTFSHKFIYFNAWNFDQQLDYGFVTWLFFKKLKWYADWFFSLVFMCPVYKKIYLPLFVLYFTLNNNMFFHRRR